MDPMSHYMISWFAGRRLRPEKRVFRVFLLSSLIPDIDVLLLLLGTDTIMKYHGTFTHSIFVVPIFAVVIALTLGRGFKKTFPWALFGVYIHLMTDFLINSAIVFKAGNPCLWPLTLAKCQLIYNVPSLAGELFVMKILVTVALYGFGIHFIRKKEYPWQLWH
jgi:membrane-bound metal-dependent hydrolase YbcI (DUF457 family)